MSVVDLLVTIIVVTILVTIALGVVTYVAYKLRLARRPAAETEGASETRYFEAHEPPQPDDAAESEATAEGEPHAS
jgi:Tfp pilus assembly protein PilE